MRPALQPLPPGGNLFPLLLVCLIAEELFHELVVNRDELFFIYMGGYGINGLNSPEKGYLRPAFISSLRYLQSVLPYLETTTGNTPLLRALFLKMSAKKLDTTTRNPYPAMAQAACSRLEPLPKFLPATSIWPE